MPYVITITGPSRSGKSEVIKLLSKISEESKYNSIFKPVLIKKYTTREFRTNELEAIKTGKEDELDIAAVINSDNIVRDADEKEAKEQRIQAFNRLGCDLVYEQYGNRYGIRLEKIYELLKNGFSPVVILNDIRTVEDIKTSLGKQCFSLFIFREIPNLQNYIKQAEKRNESRDVVNTRFEKATAIYRIYIENIHIFDKLILNVKEDTQSLEVILTQLIEHLTVLPLEFK